MNIPATNGKDLSSSVEKICAKYFNEQPQRKEGRRKHVKTKKVKIKGSQK
jgi:hypothetical protein